MTGSSKADILQGHAGSDNLTGGGGSDIFKFDTTNDGIVAASANYQSNSAEDLRDGDTIAFAAIGAGGTYAVDTITDWVDGADKIDTGSVNNYTCSTSCQW